MQKKEQVAANVYLKNLGQSKTLDDIADELRQSGFEVKTFNKGGSIVQDELYIESAQDIFETYWGHKIK